MKKDHIYYEGRIIKASQSLHQRLIQGKTADEIYDMLDELNASSSTERIYNIGEHLHEAFAIIRQMLRDPSPADPNKIYDIMWIDRVSNLRGEGKMMQRKWTRSEMLDRLHWITSEEFGEDLEEWKSWMAAFEENPPAWGGR